ncbi:prepilin peptidase [Gorillibacterium sp. sgz5001074]|uniref:prepilin peptidase n=1 Tax=Gorillibacterium sp. sgz5001074 TaxID=3446695 RepID=UPI003F668FD5
MNTIIQAFQVSPAYFYTMITILGLLIGSFLNVVAIRVPKGMSVVHPPSHCTSCGHQLGPLDLIPVFNWFFSRGKCRYCGEAYSVQYTVWEAMTGLLFLLTAVTLGPVPELIAGLVLVSILITIVQTDLRYMLIPNRILVFGLGSGVLLRIGIHPLPVWDYALAFLIGGGLLYLLAWLGEVFLKKESMGGGDIKLMAVLGLFVGMKGVILTLFLGSVIGLFLSFILIVFRRLKTDQFIPFGPYLAAGAWVAYLWGDSLLHLYINLFIH